MQITTESNEKMRKIVVLAPVTPQGLTVLHNRAQLILMNCAVLRSLQISKEDVALNDTVEAPIWIMSEVPVLKLYIRGEFVFDAIHGMHVLNEGEDIKQGAWYATEEELEDAGC